MRIPKGKWHGFIHGDEEVSDIRRPEAPRAKGSHGKSREAMRQAIRTANDGRSDMEDSSASLPKMN